MLLIDTTLPEVIWVVFTAVTGMIAIGAGIIGYWMRPMNWIERVLAIISGLLLIYPEGISDVVGLIMFAGLFAVQFIYKKDSDQTVAREA